MKRSIINSYIKEAEQLLADYNIILPSWASWTKDDWLSRIDDCENIFVSNLGWDLTNFGSDDYLKRGLLLFTIRNGNELEDLKPYAEKIMIVKENQETPFHFHWSKTEDIINRGGGNLIIELFNRDNNEDFADSPVTFLTDGIKRSVKAGGRVSLAPGESITLTKGMYHRFYAEGGKGIVLAGEVSMTNNDSTDNRFYENCGRFPEVEEDTEEYRLLVSDYARFRKGTKS